MIFEHASKNKKIFFAILSVILLGGIVYLVPSYFNSESRNQRKVQTLVKTFGKRLQNVSLLAPREILIKSMEENYGDLASSPVLIAEWVAQALENPSSVPGRLTSSPWPDRIEITSVEKISDYTYEVEGEVVEISNGAGSTSNIVAKRSIVILAEKRRDLGNRWYISSANLDFEDNGRLSGGFGNAQLEKVITNYLVRQERFSWQTKEGSINFCSIENLDKANQLSPLDIWAYCAEYIIEDGKLKTESGSSGPVKINYPNELSYYDLRKFSYEVPGDGSAYSKDIKRIFPEKLHDIIFNFDRNYLIQKNEATAIINNLSWEKIKQAINNCEVKETFQSHSREVSATLKNGTRIEAVEPRIDDIIKIAVSAEPKCGRIMMATE